MFRILLMLAAACICACRPSHRPGTDSTLYQSLSAKRVQLPNQWKITPAGIAHLPLGDLPLQIAVSPDKKHIAVTNNGVGAQKIQLFGISGNNVVQLSEAPIAKAWYGLAFSQDGKRLYASGGNDNLVAVYSNGKQQFRADTSFQLGLPWPKGKICPAGLSLDEPKQHLLTVTKEDSALYVLNLNGKLEKRIPLPSEPYAVLVSEKREEVYVSLWGSKAVLVFDRDNFTLKGKIAVGDHPNEMILNKTGTLLFVANSLDNSVSVVDLEKRKLLEVLNAALYPDAPNGSTTNSLALSPDERTLYIANADNNCLSVYDVHEPGESRSLGFIPTGWYPTSVRCVGDKILVANGKGMTSLANPKGPSPFKKGKDSHASQYIGELYLGTLSVIPKPDEAQLKAYTKLVYENCPYNKSKELQTEGEAGNPIPH